MMPRSATLLVSTILLATAVGRGSAADPDYKAFAAVVPAKAYAFAYVRSLADLDAALEGTALGAAIRGPNMAAFRFLVDDWGTLVAQQYADPKADPAQVKEFGAGLKALLAQHWTGPFAVAYGRPAAGAPLTDGVLFLAALGGGGDVFWNDLWAFRGRWAPGEVSAPAAQEGVYRASFGTGLAARMECLHSNIYVAPAGRDLVELAAATRAQPASALATADGTFAKALERVRADGALFVAYVRFPDVLGEDGPQLAQRLGIDQVAAMALSVTRDGVLFRSRVAIILRERGGLVPPGLLGILPHTPLDEEELRVPPADAEMVLASSSPLTPWATEFAPRVKVLAPELAQTIERARGEDSPTPEELREVSGVFPGGTVWYRLRGQVPAAGLVISARHQDRRPPHDVMEAVLRWCSPRLDLTMPAVGPVGGQWIGIVPRKIADDPAVPLSAQIDRSPASLELQVGEKRVHLATSPAALEEALRPRQTNFADHNEDFRSLRQRLPVAGAHLVYYSDSRTAIARVVDALRQSAAAPAVRQRAWGRLWAALPEGRVFTTPLGGTLTVGRYEGDAYVFESVSSLPLLPAEALSHAEDLSGWLVAQVTGQAN